MLFVRGGGFPPTVPCGRQKPTAKASPRDAGAPVQSHRRTANDHDEAQEAKPTANAGYALIALFDNQENR